MTSRKVCQWDVTGDSHTSQSRRYERPWQAQSGRQRGGSVCVTQCYNIRNLCIVAQLVASEECFCTHIAHCKKMLASQLQCTNFHLLVTLAEEHFYLQLIRPNLGQTSYSVYLRNVAIHTDALYLWCVFSRYTGCVQFLLILNALCRLRVQSISQKILPAVSCHIMSV